MGGNALLPKAPPSSSFPRIPTETYLRIKRDLLHLLRSPEVADALGLTRVEVPAEAPGKEDFGDFDFMVLLKPGGGDGVVVEGREGEGEGEGEKKKNKSGDAGREVGTRERNRKLAGFLGAEFWSDGEPTSHFGVPSDSFLAPTAYQDHETAPRRMPDGGDDVCKDEGRGRTYYQIDIHVCRTEEEFGLDMMFHSYGDLGMMFGILAKVAGGVDFSAGSKGLRISTPNGHLTLTTSPESILTFLDLSSSAPPFNTLQEIFEYTATSRHFIPGRIIEICHNRSRYRQQLGMTGTGSQVTPGAGADGDAIFQIPEMGGKRRKMFSQWYDFVLETNRQLQLHPNPKTPDSDPDSTTTQTQIQQTFLHQTLQHFSKLPAYQRLLQPPNRSSHTIRRILKTYFTPQIIASRLPKAVGSEGDVKAVGDVLRRAREVLESELGGGKGDGDGDGDREAGIEGLVTGMSRLGAGCEGEGGGGGGNGSEGGGGELGEDDIEKLVGKVWEVLESEDGRPDVP